MDAELLLTWMSETGAGGISELRQRIAWLARTADMNPKPYETGRWLRDISALGHAEVDWDSGRWAIAPAAAALLPAAGGTAVLAGTRRVGLREMLDEQDVAVFVEYSQKSHDRLLPVPDQIFVQADSIAELKRSLAAAGVRYVGSAAGHLADRLPLLALGKAAAPPPRDLVVEHLDPSQGTEFRQGLPLGDGLCRMTVFGRKQYLYRADGEWRRTNHSNGVLYDHAARGREIVRWRRVRTSGNIEIGTTFVDQGAPLPPLQARTLVLCSGLPAAFGNAARTAIYQNVPQHIAEQVARSIRQRLAVVD